MATEGYIALHRKVLDSAVWQDQALFYVWCWCLLRASYKHRQVLIKTGRGSTLVEIGPGEFVTGRNAGARELKMRPSSFRNRLYKLSEIGNIALKVDKQYTVIKVVNWDTYQSKEEKEDKQRTSKGQAKDTNNKDNKDNNNTLSCPHEDILALWKEILPELVQPIPKLWNVNRRKLLSARWNTSAKTKDLEWWRSLFTDIRESDFLMGRSNKWKVTLDWLIKRENFTKVVEGKYF